MAQRNPREDDTPWEPFHVEQGFRRDSDAIKVFGTGPEEDVGDQGNNTGDGLLRTIAYNCTAGGGSYIINLAGGSAEFSQLGRNRVREGLLLRESAYIIARGNADVCHLLIADLTGGQWSAAELVGATQAA